MAGKIFVALANAVLDLPDGGRAVIVAGQTRVREGHPLLRGRESLFQEINAHFEFEDARSAPQDEPKPKPVRAEEEPSDEAEQVPEGGVPAALAPKPSGLTSESTPGVRRQRGPRKGA
jgi:hypothetical protein